MNVNVKLQIPIFVNIFVFHDMDMDIDTYVDMGHSAWTWIPRMDMAIDTATIE